MSKKPSTIFIETLTVGQMAANCYVLFDPETNEVLIIDPGDDPEYIIDHIERRGGKPVAIIATHGHFDHIMAARALQLAYTIPFMIHKDDGFLVDRMAESAKHFLELPLIDPPPHVDKVIEDNEYIQFGGTTFRAIHTPGHTPGSICLYEEKQGIVFVGDTIFKGGSVGRTDFSYSDKSDLARSIAKIFTLSSQMIVYPGHGELTSVANESDFHIV